MLRFFYTQDINWCLDFYTSTFDLCANAYVVASKYGCQRLQDEVLSYFDWYHQEYTDYPRESASGRTDLLAAMAVAFDSATSSSDVKKLREYLVEYCQSVYYEHYGYPEERYCVHHEHRCVKKQSSWKHQDREPFLHFLSEHAEAAQYFTAELGEFKDLEAVTVFECPGCGATLSDDGATCDGETSECGKPAKPTTHFRVKVRSTLPSTSDEEATAGEGQDEETDTEDRFELVVQKVAGRGLRRGGGWDRGRGGGRGGRGGGTQTGRQFTCSFAL